jgi:hypothetical protein
MARRKSLTTLEYNIEAIKKAYDNNQVVKIFQYISKSGVVNDQIEVLPIDYDIDFDFFQGFIVNIDGLKVSRTKSRLSRFYFDRLNKTITPYNKDFLFDKDLIKSVDNYKTKHFKNKDSFGWFIGTGDNLKNVDLIYGDVFEKYIKKYRKDIYKNKKIYLNEREAIESKVSKKFNRKLTITYLYEKDILEFIIGHLHDVKIKCDAANKSKITKLLHGYVGSNLLIF